MLCVKCKAEIEDDSIYCRFCGKKQVFTAGQKKHTRTVPNGCGTVRKRGNTYTAIYRIVRRGVVVTSRTKGGFATKAAAREYIPTLKGQDDAAPVYTVNQIWDRLQVSQKWLKISKDKRSHYATAYKRLAPIHDRDVSSLRYFELQNLIDGFTGAFYPKRDAKTVLQKIVDLAVLQEAVPPTKADIIRCLELPSKPLTAQDARTPDEIKAMWDDWKNSKDLISAYALIMAYTGMRTGELFAQDVGRVDLEKQVIVGGIKTDAGIDREIPIADSIVPVVRAVLPSVRYGLVAYDENTYYAEWARMIARTGIRPLGSYCQRHTCQTRLEELVPAVSKAVINSIMGHSNGKVDDAYTHIGLAAKLAAVNRLKLC